MPESSEERGGGKKKGKEKEGTTFRLCTIKKKD